MDLSEGRKEEEGKSEAIAHLHAQFKITSPNKV